MEAGRARSVCVTSSGPAFVRRLTRLPRALLVSLLATAAPAAAYDGPPPLRYNRTLDSIRVVFTTPGRLIANGKGYFTVTATVPIVAETVGQSIDIEVRSPSGTGHVVVASCSHVPTAEDVDAGTGVYTCEAFAAIPGLAPTATTVELYPYVMRRGSAPGAVLQHDGQAHRLTAGVVPETCGFTSVSNQAWVTVMSGGNVGDDPYEPNDTAQTAAPLGATTTPIEVADLVHLNADHYQFVAGQDASTADITIRFWHEATNLDLYVYGAGGDLLGASTSNDDEERVTIPVVPGGTYRVAVLGVAPTAAFYDLAISTAAASVITFTADPSGSPNPVAGGGTAAMSVATSHAISQRTTSYFWTATCPNLADAWTLNSRYATNPTWVAPANGTVSPQSCVVRVEVSDSQGINVQRDYTHVVSGPAHGLTFTVAPVGSPNPAGSGSPVTLAATATDALGHSLEYAWQATCSGLPSNGSFAPSASVQAPTWTAPANLTGRQRSCALTATANDGLGLTLAAGFSQSVNAGGSCTHTVTPLQITATAAGGPQAVTVNGATVVLDIAQNTDPDSRVGTITIAGQTVTVTQAGVGYTYYFAEGATIGGFFETRFAVLNLDSNLSARVQFSFQLKDSATVLPYEFFLGPGQRTTVNVSDIAGFVPQLSQLASAEFSTVIRSDVLLVVDRTMMWDSRGYGSHAETSITAPASTWYLAEGATIGDFELYYLIQNPNPTPLTNEIEVTYLLPPPQAPIVRTYSMGANTRRNIAVHIEGGLENAEVSAIIRTPADKPVIVERAMYLTAGGLFYGAGHGSAGIRAPATQWFFAEGATGDFFDLFILIGNPNPTGAQVTATFLFDDGTTCSTRVGSTVENGELVVGPQSRYNIWVDATTIPGCPRNLANAARLDHDHDQPAGGRRAEHVVAGADGGQLGRGPQCAGRHHDRHALGAGGWRAGWRAQHRDLHPHREHVRLRRHRPRHAVLRRRLGPGDEGLPAQGQQPDQCAGGGGGGRRRLRAGGGQSQVRRGRGEPARSRPGRAGADRGRARHVLQRPWRPVLGRRDRCACDAVEVRRGQETPRGQVLILSILGRTPKMLRIKT